MGVRYGVSLSPLGLESREGAENIFFIFGSQNAYFGEFSGPSECLLLHCIDCNSPGLDSTPVHSDIP